jgi:hypothetical protein
MRTVKVTEVHVLTPTYTLTFETEEFIEDDRQALEAGRRARKVLGDVFDGMIEGKEGD